MDTFVKLENITKIYHMGEVEIRAVDGIDFSIQKGEFVVIVGPSGAGKTTVLNILGGMDTASGGRITVDGQDITKYSERQLTGYRRDDIGFVFDPESDCSGECRDGASDLPKSAGCKSSIKRSRTGGANG